MPWKVKRCTESHHELVGLLMGLGPAAHQAAIEHFQKLPDVDDAGREIGRIVDLPFFWVYPDEPRREEYPIVRLQVSDDAFGHQELCVFLAFAYLQQKVGVLGCTWWDPAPDWLDHHVNGHPGNPTFEEYLSTRKIGGRKTLLKRYRSFCQRYGD